MFTLITVMYASTIITWCWKFICLRVINFMHRERSCGFRNCNLETNLDTHYDVHDVIAVPTYVNCIIAISEN